MVKNIGELRDLIADLPDETQIALITKDPGVYVITSMEVWDEGTNFFIELFSELNDRVPQPGFDVTGHQRQQDKPVG